MDAQGRAIAGRQISAQGYGLVGGGGLALAALLIAPLAGLNIGWRLRDAEGQVTWLDLVLGVFFLGYVVWWWLLARPRRFSLRRGAVAGVLVACLAYPAVLLLAQFVRLEPDGAPLASLAERLDYVLVLSALALLTTGFVGALSLSLAGIGMALICARIAGPTPVAAPAPAGLTHQLVQGVAGLAAGLLVFLLIAFVSLWLLPLPASTLEARPAPVGARSYQASMAALAAIGAAEAGMALHPRCGSTLLSHGHKVARVVVYFHGLTNCPAQADELGQKLFALGYNVLIPRLPYHGEADPMTLALENLTAETLATSAHAWTALAQGLGDEVVVVGLSAGGTMAALLAQQQDDVDRVVAVAPFFGPYLLPRWAMWPAANLLLLLPNRMVWWNPLQPYVDPAMDYAYPRFATHALGQVMRLGLAVEAAAQVAAPRAPHIGMLLNEADLAVSNAMAQDVAKAWQAHGRAVAVQMLPAERRLPHDLIDPRQAKADVDFVYPLLIEMLGAPDARPRD